jgi:serpin B
LPYDGGELSMLILLPREIDGIGKLEKHLTLKGIDRCRNLLSMNSVDVLLPKFKVTSKLRLEEILSSMGMIDAFALDKADFSGLDGSRDLYIAAVIHQAFVEVNESGTEAAAATAVYMGWIGVTDVDPVKPKRFHADRPFIFIIQENTTGCILFMGRVVDPSMTGE